MTGHMKSPLGLHTKGIRIHATGERAVLVGMLREAGGDR
jgi:hypothetical protein